MKRRRLNKKGKLLLNIIILITMCIVYAFLKDSGSIAIEGKLELFLIIIGWVYLFFGIPTLLYFVNVDEEL